MGNVRIFSTGGAENLVANLHFLQLLFSLKKFKNEQMPGLALLPLPAPKDVM
jgi:hypothetical protein